MNTATLYTLLLILLLLLIIFKISWSSHTSFFDCHRDVNLLAVKWRVADCTNVTAAAEALCGHLR